MRPRILVSPDFTRPGQSPREQIRLDLRYLQMLEECRATPVVATPYADPRELAALCDGWLITGGDDLPAELLGESLHPEARVAHPLRIQMERDLYNLLRKSDKPILGICFGCQFLNVIEGGTLIQHLPDRKEFSEHRDTVHAVRIRPDTALREIVGDATEVASAHHQAIREVAPGWRVAAVAEDGVIEAIERSDGPFRLGVQWHPERTPESPASQALFHAFVEAANRAVARARQG